MLIQTTLLLSISDYCRRVSSPPRFVALLFGSKDGNEILESCEFPSIDLLKAEAQSGEKLELMNAVLPGIDLVGLALIGHGLEPTHTIDEKIHEVLKDASRKLMNLLLIDLTKQDMPACRSFKINNIGDTVQHVQYDPCDFRLVADESTSVAISDALASQNPSDNIFAKRVFRDKLINLQERLSRSTDKTEQKEIIRKYGQLKKTSFGASSGLMSENETNNDIREIGNNKYVAYELMAHVIGKSDERHNSMLLKAENNKFLRE